MPREAAAKFEVNMLRVLDEEGNCDEALKPQLSAEQVKQLYELMVLTRTFDDLALYYFYRIRLKPFGYRNAKSA